MPTDRPREWFASSTPMVDWCRLAAARCAPRERRPQLIHHHRYADDCEGFRHERLGTVEQLALDGFELDREVLDGAARRGVHSQRDLGRVVCGGDGGSVAGR